MLVKLSKKTPKNYVTQVKCSPVQQILCLKILPKHICYGFAI